MDMPNDDEFYDITEKRSSRVKSADEIKSHTIDENLNEFKKMGVLLKSNYEAQIIVGLKSFPALLNQDKQYCVQKLIPILKETCFLNDLTRTLEFYQTLNECLLEILSSSLMTSKEFANHFANLIANKVYTFCDKSSDYESYSISQLWIDLMFQIVQLLSDNCVKTAIFEPVLMLKLQYVSKWTRIYLSQLLAKCAVKLSPQTVKSDLYPLILDLCNDTQYEVRSTACEALPAVCESLGAELTMDIVLPELFKYLSDESTLVKTSCFVSLIKITSLFGDQLNNKDYLLVKVQSFVEYGLYVKDEHYLATISKNLGLVLRVFKDVMDNQSRSFFVNAFCQLCKDETLYLRRTSGESKFIWCKCRINLAECFTDVVHITNSISYENKLSQCLTSLVKDKNEAVRMAICKKIVSIAKALGRSQYFLVINDFCTCLSDESNEVLNLAVNNLEAFLSLFIKKESNGILCETNQMPSHQIVLKRLVNLEDSLSQSYKYAMHAEILQAFSLLPWLISTTDLIEKILPILRLRIQSRALPVRLTAIKTMLIILRKIPKMSARNACISDLVEFSVHTNCYKRIQYVEICKYVIELYSKKFFKANFYQNLIQLADDRVPNVKISFLKLLVELKRMWRLPNDREKLDNLETVARKLLHDKDKDVFDLAQKAILQMDGIKSFLINEVEEQTDKVKESEENFLNELESKKVKSSFRLTGKCPSIGGSGMGVDQISSPSNSSTGHHSTSALGKHKSLSNSRKQFDFVGNIQSLNGNGGIINSFKDKPLTKDFLNGERLKSKSVLTRRYSTTSEILNCASSPGSNGSSKKKSS